MGAQQPGEKGLAPRVAAREVLKGRAQAVEQAGRGRAAFLLARKQARDQQLHHHGRGRRLSARAVRQLVGVHEATQRLKTPYFVV